MRNLAELRLEANKLASGAFTKGMHIDAVKLYISNVTSGSNNCSTGNCGSNNCGGSNPCIN